MSARRATTAGQVNDDRNQIDLEEDMRERSLVAAAGYMAAQLSPGDWRQVERMTCAMLDLGHAVDCPIPHLVDIVARLLGVRAPA